MTLTATFTARRGALQLEADLRVAAGETTAVLGPNGAGKTSFLRALAGLLPLDRGRIALGDRALDDTANGLHLPPQQRGVGFVFQDHLLFPHLDARDNIAFGLVSRGVKQRLARAAAENWLERIGLAEHAKRMPRALSGGQAQRVALARALCSKPDLLLLDEPLASVDATARLELRALLRSQLEDFPGCCVLVAHQLEDAIALADRVAVLEGGRVVQHGPIHELGNKPATRYVADLVGLNCYRGTCDDNVLTVAGGCATIIVGTSHQGPVVATLHPRAVALFRERPSGSPRNVWQAPVLGTERALGCVRVRLGGPVPVTAEVTDSAVRDLGLDQGGAVWIAIKATEFRVASV